MDSNKSQSHGVTESRISGSAGKRGTTVRSDCWIEITKKSEGGAGSPSFNIKSKVGKLYGAAIRKQLEEMATFFNLGNVDITLEDAGALPFVMAARFEAAVKRMDPTVTSEYLMPFLHEDIKSTTKNHLRRSRLYLPGNEPKFFVNAGLHGPDGIILDLEDSVAHDEKDAARHLVRNALRSVDFYGTERMVRINQLPMGLEDLRFVVPAKVNLILIPKVEEASQILEVEKEVLQIKAKHGISGDIWFMPIIESAKGAINAYEIAKASDFVCSLAIGLEDYTADIGAERTLEGTESFWARMQVVNAAKAAGIQAIDSVFSDIGDMEGLVKSTIESKSFGFEGKGCIHPRQIQPIHNAFAPTSKEIEKALKIVMAFEDALSKGLAAVSLGTKMIDPPVVKRAQGVIELAIQQGMLKSDWMVNNGNG